MPRARPALSASPARLLFPRSRSPRATVPPASTAQVRDVAVARWIHRQISSGFTKICSCLLECSVVNSRERRFPHLQPFYLCDWCLEIRGSCAGTQGECAACLVSLKKISGRSLPILLVLSIGPGSDSG